MRVYASAQALAGMEFLLHARVHAKIGHLDLPICHKLVAALLSYAKRRKPGWTVRMRRLTDNAELALRILAGFVEEVEEMRVAIAEQSANTLRQNLKVLRSMAFERRRERESESNASLLPLPFLDSTSAA